MENSLENEFSRALKSILRILMFLILCRSTKSLISITSIYSFKILNLVFLSSSSTTSGKPPNSIYSCKVFIIHAFLSEERYFSASILFILRISFKEKGRIRYDKLLPLIDVAISFARSLDDEPVINTCTSSVSIILLMKCSQPGTFWISSKNR